MRNQRILAALLAFLICSAGAAAKDKKKKILLPADVLQARTVLVVIDPHAGMSAEAPYANRIAQEDVEKALMTWGRFELTTDVSTADLIIEIRKGNGKIAEPTIGGLPQNNRPVTAETGDSNTRIGASRGTPPMGGDPTGPGMPMPSPQLEVGEADDMFVVYRGKRDNALNAPAVWRYTGRDALSSPGVPAVDRFRKLIVEAEKQQASNP